MCVPVAGVKGSRRGSVAAAKLVAVGFGIKKLQITCVIEDAKVESMDAIIEDEIVKCATPPRLRWFYPSLECGRFVPSCMLLPPCAHLSSVHFLCCCTYHPMLLSPAALLLLGAHRELACRSLAVLAAETWRCFAGGAIRAHYGELS